MRERRGARGLSQGDLGKALGVSRQTINAIETGRYLPSLPLAIALARYFETTVEDIFLAENRRPEMNQTMNNWNVQLIGMLAIAAAVFGVFWAAEGFEEAWPSAAILLGFIPSSTSAATAATRSTS